MRILHHQASAALFLAAILLSSCSAPDGLPASGPLDPAAVVAAVDARNAGIRTLQASGSVSVETPDISNSGNILVRLSRPDSLFVDITGPFGVGIAKGLITTLDFTLYNSLENTILRGKTTPRNLRSVLRIEIDFAEILAAIAGSLSIPGAPPLTGVRSGDSYILRREEATLVTEYEVSLEHAAVTRRTKKTTEGALIEELLFRDFRKRDNVFLPSVVSVVRPLRSENLTLIFERMTLNEMPLDFAFKLPKSASTVNL